MTDDGKKLLEALRKLPISEQAEIAAELLAQLHPPTTDEGGSAWSRELERRSERAASGESKGTPWQEAKERIEREILGKD